jgi:cytochrome b pre-mRNA-processing protein 3
MTMGWLARLLGKDDLAKAAMLPLWRRVVATAREPGWYARGGVADSVEGRFDMIVLVLAAVLLRLEQDETLIEPAARLTECFVADMEGQLREQGIGDPALGKRMGKLIGALGGRTGALRAALATPGDDALTQAVARNVTFGENAQPAAIGADLRLLIARLAQTPDARLLAGEIAAETAV